MPVYDELREIGDEALDTGNVVVLDEFWGRNRQSASQPHGWWRTGTGLGDRE